MTNFVTRPAAERAFLVGAELRGGRGLLPMNDSIEELELLADTAGMEVVGVATQNLDRIDPATFIGSGKVEEIKTALVATEAQVVIFDDELSPRHQRELEKRFGDTIKVIDRSTLILDIFAQHARTREGSLQVELAQYEYRLPRLTRQWSHLVRQSGGGSGRSGSGGVGLRGPGETQLEDDRREIRHKITQLRNDLESVRQHREQHRTQRERGGIPSVALVGYTNAGKSTLLRALTGTDVYIADQLFATLDPTTRRVVLPAGREFLLSDTVGFIQKLPTTLIAAFRATLEEINSADVILLVADSSHSNVTEHIDVVADTLAEIDVPPVPQILVWNKYDKLQGGTPPPAPQNMHFAKEVEVSATTGFGLGNLLKAIEEVLSLSLRRQHLLIPHGRGDLVSTLHQQATVESVDYLANGVLVTVLLPAALLERFRIYQVKNDVQAH